MSEFQCCETCARLMPSPLDGWWCNALWRRIYDWDMDVYPPCGKARWMPKRDQNVKDDDDGE